ncbi:putative glycoside hydrolase [Marasmitruncus massiliensis]|uniref:putative glycoside hydrolase n=1 Tax=Marasmitruncus massiliensis TaxID=1944642 RepID=UPI000C7CBF47|nr:putative glycoside hydrolase [Marasmitruncus massiliensis]
MAKGFKVKRYNRIYRGGRSPASRALHMISICAAVFILGFIGWSAYGPVMDYLEGQAQSAFQPADSSSVPESSQPPEESDETAAQEPAKPGQPSSDTLHGIYLPAGIIADVSSLDAALSSIDTGKFNAVYFDLKDDAGNVLYRSFVENATLAPQSYDLSMVCGKITAKGLTPIGRISAFRDPLAASKIKDAGVRYGNTEILWNDDDPARGGKPWLNPYSVSAQDYVIGLAEEAVGMGVSAIVYTNVCFPSGYSLNLASYGNVTQPKSDALAAFIDAAEERIATAGGKLWVYTGGPAALGTENSHYGDQNPLALANSAVLVDAMPVQFGDGFTQDRFTVTEPLLNPRQTVDTLLKTLSPGLSGKEVIAVLQGYTAEGQFAHNKAYTAQDMEDQIAALTDNGIQNYIFYSPDGNYPNQEAS